MGRGYSLTRGLPSTEVAVVTTGMRMAATAIAIRIVHDPPLIIRVPPQ